MKNPQIILVITDQDPNKSIASCRPDMIEMRVDLLPCTTLPLAFQQFQNRRKLNIPILLTVRNDKKEGAQKVMTDAKKWELLQGLMPLTDWVDIELSSKLCQKTIAFAHALKKKVVISAHNFKTTPKNIAALYKQAKQTKADAIKFAFNATNEEDLIRLVKFTKEHRKENVITMCVGQWGPLSRLVLPAVGSRWVYTFLTQSTAPGQMDIKTLKRLMNSAID